MGPVTIGRGRRRGATTVVTTLGIALVLLLTSCADGSAPSARAPDTATATGPSPPGSAATTARPVPRPVPPPTPAAPTTTTTTTTATTIPPPGNAIPGGPVRTTTTELPVPAGPCTETVGRVERLSFQSNVLAINQPDQRYRVYTPRCYRYDQAAHFPILYLFHGAQTDESQWDDVGVFAAADRLIAARTIAPMIIVLPDGIWSMGSYDDEPPLFERWLLGELMPAVEHDYRTIGDKADRAIGGISRGGEWAIIEGGRHPELFGAVGGHSPAVGPPSTPTSFLVPLYRASRGQRLWLDVGNADSLLGPITTLDQAWTEAGVVHELHTAPGRHDRTYWSSQVDAYLRFYAAPWPLPQ